MTRVGEVVGSIRLESVLGTGGMGEVYLGYDTKLERHVAVKMLQPTLRVGERRRERFLREARLLSRLGHPSICQVHDLVVGEEADYLVLEYVPGRTLTEALAEEPPFALRLDLAEKIARALAAAHRARIVHRDLKADNIMVTPQGEIKVLDFGIARSLAAADEAAAADELLDDDAPGAAAGDAGRTEHIGLPVGAAAAARPSRGLTRRGLIVGTVAAMSPEQASGRPIDEASDLYSLGVLLQEMFTGEAAYPDLPREELVRLVQRAQTLPIRGLDADLAALIHDLENLDPRRRPSAAAVAARLRWVAEKPQRERRRRLRIAAVTGAFVVLAAGLAVVSRLAWVASHARAEAEGRRVQAENLIDFMLGDLRHKLTGVGRLELLDAVGDRALAYFDSVPESQWSVADLEHRVQTIVQIGEVRRTQGKSAAALAAFERGRALAEQAVARHPEARELRVREADANTWIGQVHYDQGEAPQAERAWRRALAIADDLVARWPDHIEGLRQRAGARHDMGTLRELQGDLPGALAFYEQSLEDLRRVVAARPEERDLQEELAHTLGFLSVVRERQGDLAAARRDRREYLALLERALARDPADAGVVQDVAIARGFVANLLASFGAPDEARALYQAGFTAIEALAAKDAQNAELVRWRVVYRLALADLAELAGAAPSSLPAVREACAMAAGLNAGDPQNKDFRLQLGLCRAREAWLEARAGRPAEARAAMRRGEAELAPLRRGDADEQLRTALALGDLQLGRAADLLGARGEAHAAYERALAALPHGGTGTYWRALAPWSEALLRLGRPGEAAAAVERLRGLGYRRPEWLELVRAASL